MTKIVLLGDATVGKSELASAMANEPYNPDRAATNGVTFGKLTNPNAAEQKIDCWDIAGPAGFRVLIPGHTRNASIILICYDTTRRSSFLNIEEYIKQVEKKEGVKFILVGTKKDLVDNRQVLENEARDYAEKHGMDFFETSAATKENTRELLEHLFKIQPKPENSAENSNRDSIENTQTKLQDYITRIEGYGGLDDKKRMQQKLRLSFFGIALFANIQIENRKANYYLAQKLKALLNSPDANPEIIFSKANIQELRNTVIKEHSLNLNHWYDISGIRSTELNEIIDEVRSCARPLELN